MPDLKDIFSAESLAKMWESVKDSIPGWISSWKDTFIDGAFSFLGIFGMIPGLAEVKQGLKEQASALQDKALSSLDPDLIMARSSTQKEVTSFFGKAKTGLNLSENIQTHLEKSAQDVATEFYKANIPALDADHKLPLASYNAVIAYRKDVLIPYLIGGGNSAGVLPLGDSAKREAEANRIATLITGVSADATWQSLAAKPPTFGLANTLAHTQSARYAEGFVKGTLPESAIAMNADTKLLVASNANITGVTNVKKTEMLPPAATPPKANAAERTV